MAAHEPASLPARESALSRPPVAASGVVIACLVFGKDLAAPGPLLAALFGLTPGAALKNPGRPELAGYYGNLAGFDVLRSARLDLIGWQIKASRVTRTAEGTQIDLWLGGERFDHGPFTIEDHE